MSGAGFSVSSVPPTKGRVLLVDDEASVLASYGRMLRRAGFVVSQLSDGGAIEAALGRHRFDVIMSDIGLPGMDGIQLLRTVRTADPDLPVVLMTGSADVSTVIDAVEHGAMRYLLKPVHPLVLCKAVEDAVQQRRRARARRRAWARYDDAASQRAQHIDLTTRFDAALYTLKTVYQPVVHCSDYRVFAYESFVRTSEPTLASPESLFAAAVKLARLHALGRAIRASVAGTIALRSSNELFFVHLHPQDLLDDDLTSDSAPLSAHAHRVVLELTERASLDDIADAHARVEKLRRMGFRLSIDNLGSGYAGLMLFAQLQPDVVKLDMALVRGIQTEPTKAKLVRSVSALCRDIGVNVIAEGVDTTSERDAIAAAGCELMQGFLFGEPCEL